MRTKVFSGFVVLAFILSLLPAYSQGVYAASPDIVISQVYGGGGNTSAPAATFKNDFIELFNRGASAVDVTGWSVQYASSAGSSWQRTNISGVIQPGQYYLVREAAGTGGTTDLPTPDATGSIAMSATSGKVALVTNQTALACGAAAGDCFPNPNIRDFVGFGTAANNFEDGGPTPNLNNVNAAIRSANGCTDTDSNNADFAIALANPRNTASPVNLCQVVADTAPSVASASPLDGAVGVAPDSNIVITFSEPVNVSGAWFGLSCTVSGAHTAAVTGGPLTFTLNPDADFIQGEACTVSILAAQVSDQDTNDPPDTLAADFNFGFSTQDVCTLAYTPIYAIQGSGPTAAITGAVTTQGVVVGDYEGPSPALRGFYIQDASGDGDPTTSDGIFVFEGNANAVSLGQVVRVSGTAAEFQGQTQITSNSVVSCGTGSVDPVDVTLPFPSADYAERYEGMLVRLPQTLYVSEHFQLGRFDEVILSSDGRLRQPTNVTTPGAAAQALQAQNLLNQIVIDDSTNDQNPDPILFGDGGNPLSAANTLRGGDTATGIVGIMTYTWAGNSASPNAYRVRPTNALGGGIPNFVSANPRPTGTASVGGTLKVGAMNLLNFFNDFGAGACFNGVGGTATDCRGADTAAEFDRQWPKTVAAITLLNPDVLGIMEMENDGYGPDSAIRFLVDRLNAATAPGTYAFIDVDAQTGQLNALGTDAIKVGLIYQPARVTPIGITGALNTGAFGQYQTGSGVIGRSRPALAQAFEQNSDGARFTIVVNHFKSKGSACNDNISPVGPDPDTGDGQGNCNLTRVAAANDLLTWLAGDPTGIGDPDVLIVGDLNSYAMEDPVTTLENGGFTNLINQFIGAEAYSYAFDGQWGYLDHALGSASLVPQVAGVVEWHINADEPSVLDYNTNFKTANLQASLYSPDQYRISDHDPVVVGLDLNAPPTVDAGGPYTVAEGASVTVTASGADVNGGPLTYAWDLDNNGSFETPGQSATFSAATLDGPSTQTIAVQVTDNGGLSTVAQATINVTNLAPVLGAITAPTSPVKVGQSFNSQASFTDAGLADTHTAVWDWGDGSSSSGVVSETNGSGSVSGSHAYASAGFYTIGLTLTDKDGAAASATFESVIVYDPQAGALSGSGLINSPAGAYPANPSAAGQAIFVVAAAYPRNANTPVGALVFYLASARLDFVSANYDWLVVNKDTHTAQLKGTGLINGKKGFKFMLWARDGSPDTFHLKIWSEDTSGVHVVYDNGSDQALTKGSISIRR